MLQELKEYKKHLKTNWYKVHEFFDITSGLRAKKMFWRKQTIKMIEKRQASHNRLKIYLRVEKQTKTKNNLQIYQFIVCFCNRKRLIPIKLYQLDN